MQVNATTQNTTTSVPATNNSNSTNTNNNAFDGDQDGVIYLNSAPVPLMPDIDFSFRQRKKHNKQVLENASSLTKRPQDDAALLMTSKQVPLKIKMVPQLATRQVNAATTTSANMITSPTNTSQPDAGNLHTMDSTASDATMSPRAPDEDGALVHVRSEPIAIKRVNSETTESKAPRSPREKVKRAYDKLDARSLHMSNADMGILYNKDKLKLLHRKDSTLQRKLSFGDAKKNLPIITPTSPAPLTSTTTTNNATTTTTTTINEPSATTILPVSPQPSPFQRTASDKVPPVQRTISIKGNDIANEDFKEIVVTDDFVNALKKKASSRAFWMPDTSATACYECQTAFSVFTRRHHCRICGQIFCWRYVTIFIQYQLLCNRCSNNYIDGDTWGYSGEVRVCNYCCKLIKNTFSYVAQNMCNFIYF